MITRWTGIALLASLSFVHCSSSKDDGNKNGSSDADSGILFTNQDGGGLGGPGGGNACTSQEDSTGCVGSQFAGENMPTDIYIMFDQSCSMSCPSEMTGFGLCCTGGPRPRIDQVRAAVDEFLQDPKSKGIGVGLGFFGYMQAGQTSCNPDDYTQPAVPVDLLPGNAPALINALAAAQPTGETPTGAAIRGACSYASDYRNQNPSHHVVVLLVTDGVPEAPLTSQTGRCNPTLNDAVQAASDCAGQNPAMDIYVLGVGGALDNLNQIAQAGGTDQAYLVQGADITSSVLDALNAIRAEAAIPCQLQIPPAPDGTTLDYNQVNVAYCDPTKTNQIIYYVQNSSGCAQDGGWYYDDPANPTHIMLCDSTCGTVSAPGGSLIMSVGCQTQVPIR